VRIGVDFHLAEREGTGNCTYSRNLVEAMLESGPEHAYFLYVTDPSLPYFGRFKRMPGVRVRSLPSGNPLIRIPALGLRSFSDRLDILHVQYAAPPFNRGSLVVTVHDLSFLHHPQCFPKAMRLYLKATVRISLRRADRVLTISEYSRKDIVESYSLPVQRIAVTPLAAAAEFKPVVHPGEAEKVLRAFGIGERYILYVGRFDARKNIPLLLRAFADLKRDLKIPHLLVLIGESDLRTERLGRNPPPLWSGDGIMRLGFVPFETLPALYSRAEAFVYPSLYEGFGLPVVEAMACGAPVIVSKSSSLPEIVGEAGLFFDPFRVDELSEAIQRVISDRTLREDMRQRGMKQAKKFNWSWTGRLTLEAYRQARG
jgi:glycosyltransferase involved in cell wall biosynthesis